jgi:uncharacterized membrane protein (UPF0127 family)
MKNLMRSLVPALALLAQGVSPACGQQPPKSVQDGKVDPLVIVSGDKQAKFDVELADSEPERNQGLMNRPTMPKEHGMLFDLGSTQQTGFFMKNTLIPLDMLFLDESGKVVAIASNARPHSLRTVSPGFAVRAVLELNGGLSKQMGFKVGDQVQHKLFKNVK